jgi:hypothetical protein
MSADTDMNRDIIIRKLLDSILNTQWDNYTCSGRYSEENICTEERWSDRRFEKTA